MLHRIMNVEKYLDRIGLNNHLINANFKNLTLLQRQHLLNIPFENLDIHWNNLIELNVSNFYEKIVDRKRGGFCYELNGLFCELLKEIGYKCKIVSARVNDGKGGFGEEYDHLAILAEVGSKEYLVDVGFGDFTAEPLIFELDSEQKDRNGIFSIRNFDDEYFEVVKKNENEWQSEYIFKNKE